jgi:hypothetical protein
MEDWEGGGASNFAGQNGWAAWGVREQTGRLFRTIPRCLRVLLARAGPSLSGKLCGLGGLGERRIFDPGSSGGFALP